MREYGKELRQIKNELHDAILSRIDLSREVADEEIEEIINTAISNKAQEQFLTLREKLRLKTELFDSIRKKGVIQPLIDDPSVTEIMVNGIEHIFVENTK